MLQIINTVFPSPEQWETIILGMRNPMNSWEKSDSSIYEFGGVEGDEVFSLGENDRKLMMNLAKGGSVHAKYRRMIPVYVTINAPLYWWKEFDTYKIGTVCNSCSTMHKIHEKEFTLSDFSYEHLKTLPVHEGQSVEVDYLKTLKFTVDCLNCARNCYLETGDKKYWWQIIQLLPTSYNQRRTVMLNYEVLTNIYHSRKNHKLAEWHKFCAWIEELPLAELITGGSND